MLISEAFNLIQEPARSDGCRPYAIRYPNIQDRGHCIDLAGYFWIPKRFDDDIEWGYYYMNIIAYKDGRLSRSPCQFAFACVTPNDILATDWYVQWLDQFPTFDGLQAILENNLEDVHG